MPSIAVILLLAVAGIACGAAHTTYPSGAGTVYLSGDAYKFVSGIMDQTGVAFGNFSDQSNHPSAFGSLRIATNAKYNSTTQMYAAGYLEGSLTQVRMFEHFTNMYNWTLRQTRTTSLPVQVSQYFSEQDAWIRQNIASNTSTLWQQMANIMAQFDGLLAGYNAAAPATQQLTAEHLRIVNSVGDVMDIIPAFVPSYVRFDWPRMTPTERTAAFASMGHCSAIVKVTGNFSELFASHSAWFTYSSLLRIFKHYELQLDTASSNGRQMSFASYPGMLSSLDDFYIMHDSKLVMLETTNGIFNQTLYEACSPHSLLAWHRVRLANMMASGGQQWADVVAQYNSGTYNNQYMLIDYKLFTPGSGLVANTLWVVEQIPGLVVSGDMTQQLERGYWPSYNVPYFAEIYEKSGYPSMLAAYGGAGGLSGVDYQLAPRAMIFRRDQDNVVDMDSLMTLMRSNNYETDPYSDKSPWSAICSRGDLAGAFSGCYDTKVTSSAWMAGGRAAAVNGPTTSGGTLPPFSWAPTDPVSHVGEPTTFNFNFEDQVFQSLL